MAVSGVRRRDFCSVDGLGRGLPRGGREERVRRGGLGRAAVCAERQNGARRSFACRRHDGPRGGGGRFSPVTFLLVSRSFSFTSLGLERSEEALWLRPCHFLAGEGSVAAIGAGVSQRD